MLGDTSSRNHSVKPLIAYALRLYLETKRNPSTYSSLYEKGKRKNNIRSVFYLSLSVASLYNNSSGKTKGLSLSFYLFISDMFWFFISFSFLLFSLPKMFYKSSVLHDIRRFLFDSDLFVLIVCLLVVKIVLPSPLYFFSFKDNRSPVVRVIYSGVKTSIAIVWANSLFIVW